MLPIFPNLPLRRLQPRVHRVGRQVQQHLPEAQLFTTQEPSAMPLDSVAQRVVADFPAQPAERVPRSCFENATDDEIAMPLPIQLPEITVPEQRPQPFRQASIRR